MYSKDFNVSHATSALANGADIVDSTAMESAFSRRCPSMNAGVDAGSEAALEEVAKRLGVALADHGCRGTPACEGLSGATKVRAAFAAESSTSRSFPVIFCVFKQGCADRLRLPACEGLSAPPRRARPSSADQHVCVCPTVSGAFCGLQRRCLTQLYSEGSLHDEWSPCERKCR